MDYPDISDALESLLIRDGWITAKRQLGRVNGVADAVGGEGSRTGPAEGGLPADLKTKMRKATGRMTRNRAAFLILVVDND